MKWFVGTSGYAYKEWKGSFYPEKLAAADMLAYYARTFGTVEINNTFYRMPQASVVGRWAEQVPAAFAFVLKASRRITHFKRLNDTNEELHYFLDVASVLENRLGPILFQLPPNFKKDLPRLELFLKQVPKRHRVAFEFRHDSWFDEDVYGALTAAGAALVAADATETVPVITPTANWGYLRLRRAAYDDGELRTWVHRIRDAGWDQAFVFFKHEAEATGPRLGRRFMEAIEE